MDFATWAKLFPAFKSSSIPNTYESKCDKYAEAEHNKDLLELRDGVTYKVVEYNNEYYVVILSEYERLEDLNVKS